MLGVALEELEFSIFSPKLNDIKKQNKGVERKRVRERKRKSEKERERKREREKEGE